LLLVSHHLPAVAVCARRRPRAPRDRWFADKCADKEPTGMVLKTAGRTMWRRPRGWVDTGRYDYTGAHDEHIARVRGRGSGVMVLAASAQWILAHR